MLENYYICIGEVLDVEQHVSEIVSKTRENLESLFSHFIEGASSSELPPTPPPSSSTSSMRNFRSKLFEKRPRSTVSSAEIDLYYNTEFQFPNIQDLDVLTWWTKHRSALPTMYKIGSQVLAVPPSTVAVEQAFSQGGHILNEKRSRLAPESLEAQVCICDWKKAEIRNQVNIDNTGYSTDEWIGDATTIRIDSSDGSGCSGSGNVA